MLPDLLVERIQLAPRQPLGAGLFGDIRRLQLQLPRQGLQVGLFQLLPTKVIGQHALCDFRQKAAGRLDFKGLVLGQQTQEPVSWARSAALCEQFRRRHSQCCSQRCCC
ncbi:hypothetical protein A2T76_20770 [Pseudomonas brenneri]|nr:hypothetical protein A2T76_20770 [Pseudomonas brenneri]